MELSQQDILNLKMLISELATAKLEYGRITYSDGKSSLSIALAVVIKAKIAGLEYAINEIFT